MGLHINKKATRSKISKDPDISRCLECSGGKLQVVTEVNLIRRPRSAEKIALCLGATSQTQHVQLHLRFDTLSYCGHIQVLAEVYDRAHDSGAVRSAAHLRDERPIDLDLVKGKHRQV